MTIRRFVLKYRLRFDAIAASYARAEILGLSMGATGSHYERQLAGDRSDRERIASALWSAPD
jgi:hypothetical protein